MLTVKDAENFLGSKYQNANLLVKKLEELELLQEITGYQRNRAFLFTPYIKLFKDYSEFSVFQQETC